MLFFKQKTKKNLFIFIIVNLFYPSLHCFYCFYLLKFSLLMHESVRISSEAGFLLKANRKPASNELCQISCLKAKLYCDLRLNTRSNLVRSGGSRTNNYKNKHTLNERELNNG
uniref:(northern house mosquito) hypothetical protein n=1 Tax=Culex pipiens TaxID=7175 RepID=A0A8D8EY99_CULPI